MILEELRTQVSLQKAPNKLGDDVSDSCLLLVFQRAKSMKMSSQRSVNVLALKTPITDLVYNDLGWIERHSVAEHLHKFFECHQRRQESFALIFLSN